MGQRVECPECGHSEVSSNHRSARIGACPNCGTTMRSWTAGKAKGRFVCPVYNTVVTLGMTGIEVPGPGPKRLEFKPGLRPKFYSSIDFGLTNERVETVEDFDGRYGGQHHARILARAAGRVFAPGCVVTDFRSLVPAGSRAAGLVWRPVKDGEVEEWEWVVSRPARYGKCASCGRRILDISAHRAPAAWQPVSKHSHLGRGRSRRVVANDMGPHPAGSFACSDCVRR